MRKKNKRSSSFSVCVLFTKFQRKEMWRKFLNDSEIYQKYHLQFFRDKCSNFFQFLNFFDLNNI